MDNNSINILSVDSHTKKKAGVRPRLYVNELNSSSSSEFMAKIPLKKQAGLAASTFEAGAATMGVGGGIRGLGATTAQP